MQLDPALAGYALEIQILGVNEIAKESGNASACAGKSLPWLQDVAAVDAWTSWQVTYRDVIVLNEDNEIVHVFNLTHQDLGDPGNYAALRDLLVGIANG